MEINKKQHGGQLTIDTLEKIINKIKGIYPEKYKDIPIYLGDDDELNGVHCCWFVYYIPTKNKDSEDWRGLINEENQYSCHPLGDNEVAIILS